MTHLKSILFGGMLGLFASSSFGQNLNDSLIAYYPLDGDVKDYSGNGNDLTNSGATSTSNFKGEADRAYSFNGTNNFMFNTTNSGLQPEEYTLSCYMKIDGEPGSGNFSIAIDNGGLIKDHGLQIAHNYSGYNGIGAYTYKLQTQSNAFHVSNGYDTADWHMYTITRNADSIILYIDGARNGSAYTGDVAGYSGSNFGFYLGCRHGNQKFFNGKLDEVKLWGRALSPAEVAQLYNNTVTSAQTVKSNANITLFPNPGNGKFSLLSNDQNENHTVRVYDMTGKLVLTKEWNTETFEIPNSKTGTYIVMVLDSKNAIVYRNKLIVSE